jgi:hypothetical protein
MATTRQLNHPSLSQALPILTGCDNNLKQDCVKAGWQAASSKPKP